MTDTEFKVYLHPRGGRPRLVDSVTTNRLSATWERDGQTYYFVTADLSARTLTYSDIRPAAVAS